MLNSATLYTSKWHRGIHLHRNMLSRGPSTPLRLQTLAGDSNHHPHSGDLPALPQSTLRIVSRRWLYECIRCPSTSQRGVAGSIYTSTWPRAVPLSSNMASRDPSASQRGVSRSLHASTWLRAIHIYTFTFSFSMRLLGKTEQAH